MDRWLDLTGSALRAIQPGLPEFDPARCLPARHSSGRCAACYEVCPHEALGPGLVPRPDPAACDGCAACIAACPTGALKSAGVAAALERWLAAVAAAPHSDGGVATAARCVRALPPDGAEAVPRRTAELTVPCLGAIRPADIVAAAVRGARKITLYAPDCSACDRAVAGASSVDSIAIAILALRTVGIVAEVDRIRVSTVSRDAAAEPRPGPLPASAGAVSRRGLFGLWRETARRAVSEVARDTEPLPARVSRQGRAPAWRLRLENDIAGLVGRTASAGGPLPVGLGIGLPLVEGSCDGCGLCALVCPLSALTVVGAVAKCRPGACTACGLCAEVCPTHGLAVRPLDSRSAIAANPEIHARAQPATATSPTGLAERAVAADRSIRDAARRPAARPRTR